MIKCYPIAFQIVSQVIERLKQHPSCMFGIASWDKSYTMQDGTNIIMPKDFNPVIMLKEYNYEEVCEEKEILSFYLREHSHVASLQSMEELQTSYENDMTFFYNNGTIDAMTYGVSNRSGMAFIKQYFHVDQCSVIGDAHNDIDMIQAFQGSCVISACEEVKQIPTHHYVGCSVYLGYRKVTFVRI